MGFLNQYETKPDVGDVLIVEARSSIDPQFGIVRQAIDSAYQEVGARVMKGVMSDDGTPDITLRISAESAESRKSFSSRPA
jgi:hypothetical protein